MSETFDTLLIVLAAATSPPSIADFLISVAVFRGSVPDFLASGRASPDWRDPEVLAGAASAPEVLTGFTSLPEVLGLTSSMEALRETLAEERLEPEVSGTGAGGSAEGPATASTKGSATTSAAEVLAGAASAAEFLAGGTSPSPADVGAGLGIISG